MFSFVPFLCPFWRASFDHADQQGRRFAPFGKQGRRHGPDETCSSLVSTLSRVGRFFGRPCTEIGPRKSLHGFKLVGRWFACSMLLRKPSCAITSVRSAGGSIFCPLAARRLVAFAPIALRSALTFFSHVRLDNWRAALPLSRLSRRLPTSPTALCDPQRSLEE